MVNWLSAYAGNIADTMFWPMIVATIVLGLVVGAALDDRSRHDFLSEKYGSATWRIHAGTQGIVIMWILFTVLSAVPEPNYNVRTKTVEVEKEVNTAVKFDDAFDMCMANQRASDVSGSTKVAKCEKQALLFTMPDVKVVKMTRTIIKRNSYTTYFDNCIRKTGKKNSTIDICHRAALEARLAETN